MTNAPLLKIYASKYTYDPAAIMGNRKGIEALRDALNKILETSSGESKATATQDLNNSFEVHCRILSDDEIATYWNLLPDQEEDLSSLSQEEYTLLNQFVQICEDV